MHALRAAPPYVINHIRQFLLQDSHRCDRIAARRRGAIQAKNRAGETDSRCNTGASMRPARLLLAGLALLQTAALGPQLPRLEQASQMVFEGLQSALRSRKSTRGGIPPGAPRLDGGDDDAGFGWLEEGDERRRSSRATARWPPRRCSSPTISDWGGLCLGRSGRGVAADKTKGAGLICSQSRRGRVAAAPRSQEEAAAM